MKYLLLILISFSAFSVCLTNQTGLKLGCEYISSVEASQWCYKKYGIGYVPYRTTETCSLEVESKYLNGYFEPSKINVTPVWNKEYRKSVEFSCSGDLSYLCHRMCEGESSCSIAEGVCKDCVGTTIDLTNLFKNIGLTITSTEKVQGLGLVNIVTSNNFVTFTSKSIYNIITSYDSKGMKRQFSSLCSDGTEYPVVFASVYSKTRELISFNYVACNDGIYELSSIHY